MIYHCGCGYDDVILDYDEISEYDEIPWKADIILLWLMMQ
jgi:hypothetical protein